jgi:hypothetical protein
VRHWRSDLELWSHEARLHPESPWVHKSLAWARWNAGGPGDEVRASIWRSYELAVLPRDRAEAAAMWSMFHVETKADAEQTELVAIRDFLDALATQTHGIASLDVGGATMSVDLSTEIAAYLNASHAFRSHRALAHARTLSLTDAEHQFRSLAQVDPGVSSSSNLVRVLALQDRWADARDVLLAAGQRHAGDPVLQRLRQAVDAGLRLPRPGTRWPTGNTVETPTPARAGPGARRARSREPRDGGPRHRSAPGHASGRRAPRHRAGVR